MMTSWTASGKIAIVTAKLCVERERYIPTSASPMPSARETAVQIKKVERVNSDPMMELSTAKRLLCFLSQGEVVLITATVFGERNRKGPGLGQQAAEPERTGRREL